MKCSKNEKTPENIQTCEFLWGDFNVDFSITLNKSAREAHSLKAFGKGQIEALDPHHRTIPPQFVPGNLQKEKGSWPFSS